MIKKLFLALIICVVVALVAGFLVSGKYEVTRTVTINGTPEDIYPHVANLKQWPRWTVWNTEKYPDMKTEYSGPTSGVGAKSAWTGEASGNGNMEITAADAPDKVEWTLGFEGFEPSQGFATFKTVENNVTRVEFGMKGSMGSNPLFKLMALTMDSAMGSEFEQCLEGLKVLVEKGEEVPAEEPPANDEPHADADTDADADKEAAAAK